MPAKPPGTPASPEHDGASGQARIGRKKPKPAPAPPPPGPKPSTPEPLKPVPTSAATSRDSIARAHKSAVVAEIVESFNDAAGAVLTEYRGLTVKELQDLRRSLGENASYAVVKNTLAKIAANQVGITGFDDLLTGPTAVAFISGDVVEAAKGLRDFAKANPALVIKGGVLDGNILDAKEIAKLADLESREVLLAKLAGAMVALLTQAVTLLNAPLARVAGLAAALEEKAGEDSMTPADDTSTSPLEDPDHRDHR